MERKIRVGAVNYLNTKPLIYGFEQGMMKDEISLVIDYPANIALQLLNDEIDVGLVPVSVIPSMKESFIISDYGIGCDGAVASVCLFSKVPLAEIRTIYLDYQSRTSVVLLKILLKEHWKIEPLLIPAEKGYEKNINSDTAVLVIGDRALELSSSSPYIFDLGLAWKELTGLPFVFAAWVSNRKLPVAFNTAFNESNMYGLNNLDRVIKSLHCNIFDLDTYYRKNIRYRIDSQAIKGLELFLQYVRTQD